MAQRWDVGSVPPTAAVFTISAAAEIAGMHPQTLRQYDRLGLVSPSRTGGGGRRYSARDIARLREVQRLSQDEGVNLAGIKRILDLENEIETLQAEVDRLASALGDARRAEESGEYRRTYLPAVREPETLVGGEQTAASAAIVVWQPRRGRRGGRRQS